MINLRNFFDVIYARMSFKGLTPGLKIFREESESFEPTIFLIRFWCS